MSTESAYTAMCVTLGIMGLFLAAGLAIGWHEYVECRRLNKELREQDESETRAVNGS